MMATWPTPKPFEFQYTGEPPMDEHALILLAWWLVECEEIVWQDEQIRATLS